MNIYMKILLGLGFSVLLSSNACEYVEVLDDGYFIEGHNLAIPHDTSPSIPSVLFGAKQWIHNDRYIIVWFDMRDSQEQSKMYYRQSHPDYIETITTFPDSLGYWVFDRYTNDNLGPLTSDELKTICKENNIDLSFESTWIITKFFNFIFHKKSSITYGD